MKMFRPGSAMSGQAIAWIQEKTDVPTESQDCYITGKYTTPCRCHKTRYRRTANRIRSRDLRRACRCRAARMVGHQWNGRICFGNGER
jgi:hypothetical protein